MYSRGILGFYYGYFMEDLNFSYSYLSLIPPILTVFLAIVTKRELMSLMVGILVGHIILNCSAPIKIVTGVASSFTNVFWNSGFNLSNLYILLFLLVLGVITSLINSSGGAHAFAKWILKRIKTRKQSAILVAVLGVIIFIDDYFNSLAVGSIGRPVTDHYKISRAKLAYLLDSTSAPVCALVPISSWGAYIIALITPILAYHGIQHITPIDTFMQIAPISYYPIFALAMIFCVIAFDIDIGPMKHHETIALQQGILTDTNSYNAYESLSSDSICKGKVGDLLIPIFLLITSVFFFMWYYGVSALKAIDGNISFIAIIEVTDVSKSLLAGSLVSLASVIILLLNRSISLTNWFKTIKTGILSMVPAISILILAWMLGDIISQIQTGKYMAYLIGNTVSMSFLPFIIFLLSSAIAFSTGTSWGTFSIMLPIAVDMSMAGNHDMLIPAMSAVISGAVFGDHCSPISDTTILSATGAGCNFMDHVTTQLPYALCVALISSIGYISLGYLGTLHSFMLTTIVFVAMVIIFVKMKSFNNTKVTA
jgi:Na+/H+ antiporter NhaC